MSTTQEIYGVTLEIYNHSDILIAATFQVATLTNITVESAFPEAGLSLDFAGTAAWGLFKFDEGPARYIIDNLEHFRFSLTQFNGRAFLPKAPRTARRSVPTKSAKETATN